MHIGENEEDRREIEREREKREREEGGERTTNIYYI